MRDSSSCTLRVLEVILNLLELLIEMGVLRQCLRQEVESATSAKEADSPNKPMRKTPSFTTGEDANKAKMMNAHRLVMTTIIR